MFISLERITGASSVSRSKAVFSTSDGQGRKLTTASRSGCHAAAERFKPFQDEILKSHKDNIHSIAITGSALTDDFDPEKSDVNSVLVLNKMDLGFLEVLASFGKTYGKKGISAPLIMTPEYIKHSLDVFPIEFLNIKLLHETLFGEDLFQHLLIERKDLRLQCERELKVGTLARDASGRRGALARVWLLERWRAVHTRAREVCAQAHR